MAVNLSRITVGQYSLTRTDSIRLPRGIRLASMPSLGVQSTPMRQYVHEVRCPTSSGCCSPSHRYHGPRNDQVLRPMRTPLRDDLHHVGLASTLSKVPPLAMTTMASMYLESPSSSPNSTTSSSSDSRCAISNKSRGLSRNTYQRTLLSSYTIKDWSGSRSISGASLTIGTSRYTDSWSSSTWCIGTNSSIATPSASSILVATGQSRSSEAR